MLEIATVRGAGHVRFEQSIKERALNQSPVLLRSSVAALGDHFLC